MVVVSSFGLPFMTKKSNVHVSITDFSCLEAFAAELAENAKNLKKLSSEFFVFSVLDFLGACQMQI